MGCRKLTYYRAETTRLKVVTGTTENQRKVVQGFISVDPMASERSWVSPYNFVQNNPIMRVDPTGALDAPIYDTEGEFLGTDDEGLQGKAIVMNKDDFKQGMSHDDALSKNLGAEGLSSDAAKSKLLDHKAGLKDRPDWDGKITLGEANSWYRSGEKGPLYADLSKIDFDFVKAGDFEGEGDSRYFQTLYDSDDGAVYGQLRLVYLGGNQVTSNYDHYNFERHSRGRQVNMTTSEKVRANVKLMLRNMATFMGRTIANRHPVNMHREGFRINFYGTGSIGND